MPNLRGASPVGRDDRGLPYAARADSSGDPLRLRRVRGKPETKIEGCHVELEGERIQ